MGYGVKGRRSHCAACIGSSVLYFGGYNATTKEHFGDVFIVNTGRGLTMANDVERGVHELSHTCRS